MEHKSITGEEKPRSAKYDHEGSVQPTQLFWGAQVVQGRAIAVTTAIGQDTLVASLVREGRFPPSENVMVTCDSLSLMNDIDEEEGISLVTRDTL